MELNNRFDVFTPFSTDQESEESFSIDIKLPEKMPVKTQSTRNMWEVPEYVEKIVPCVDPIAVQEQTALSGTKGKTSRSNRKQKSNDPISQSEVAEEQQQADVESAPVAEVRQQSLTHTYYPPQPYKFKPSAASKCLINFKILNLFSLTNSSSKREVAKIQPSKYGLT